MALSSSKIRWCVIGEQVSDPVGMSMKPSTTGPGHDQDMSRDTPTTCDE